MYFGIYANFVNEYVIFDINIIITDLLLLMALMNKVLVVCR